MNHGIVVALVLTIGLHDFLQVRSKEHRHQIIHNPSNALIKVVTCQIVEYLTQERIGLWNQLCSLLSAKILRCFIV